MKAITVMLARALTTLLPVLLLSVLPAAAQMPPVRVACVGNSITIGYGLPHPNTAYPQQFGRLLGSGYDVRNFGVSGRTMLKKGDYPYWKEQFFKEALAFKPQILTICLGTNDSVFFFDGVHPDSTGDSIMARIAFEAIEESPSGIIRHFSAKSHGGEKGGQVTMYWQTTRGSRVTLNGKVVGASDSVTVSPKKNSTFILTASGAVSDTSAITVP